MTVVNGLEEARAALAAGALALASPPFAACHAGVGYYEALLLQLRAEFPESDFVFTLDCGDDAAIAHEAIRRGFTSVRCQCSEAVKARLEALVATASMGGRP